MQKYSFWSSPNESSNQITPNRRSSSSNIERKREKNNNNKEPTTFKKSHTATQSLLSKSQDKVKNQSKSQLLEDEPIETPTPHKAPLSHSISKLRTTSISEEVEKRLEKLFYVFDKDRDGMISSVEFRNLLQKITIQVNPQNCYLLIRQVDSNQDGLISLQEYNQVIKVVFGIKKLFNKVDHDKNGSLDFGELQDLFKFLEVNDQKIRWSLFKMFDQSQTNSIQLDELYNLVVFYEELRFQYDRYINYPSERNKIWEDLSKSTPIKPVSLKHDSNKNLEFEEFASRIIFSFQSIRKNESGKGVLPPPIRKQSKGSKEIIRENKEKPKLQTRSIPEYIPETPKHNLESKDPENKPQNPTPPPPPHHSSPSSKTKHENTLISKSDPNHYSPLPNGFTTISRRVKAPKLQIPSLQKSVSKLPKSISTLALARMESCKFVTGLWRDPNFKPSDEIIPEEAKSKVIWKRPTEFAPDPHLFIDGVEAGDVIQGALGDCWFVSALAVLATAENIIDSLFVSQNPIQGIYQIKFFKNGNWEVVDIDDLIPVHKENDKPLFASCFNKNEMWVPLVEKAYAKLHGSYQAIESGSISDALRDLTGEAVEILPFDVLELTQQQNSIEKFWKKLKNYQSESYLMCCAFFSPTARREESTEFGLLMNHAYSILECRDFHGNRLLRIRNPWGREEWNGSWSDGSSEWTLQYQKELNQKFENDGTFYMSFEDFVVHFNRIHVVRMMTDTIGIIWKKRMFQGEWNEETSGGCSNYSSWPKNPQFLISSTSPTQVFVSLSQEDKRFELRNSPQFARRPYKPIGIHIIRVFDKTPYKINSYETEDEVITNTFVSSRDVGHEISMEKDSNYIIIPCFFEPNINSRFVLEIYSVEQVEITPLTKPKPFVSVNGKWDETTAGGCSNFSSWKNNPQYILTVDRQIEVEILLETKFQNESIGISLCKNEESNGRMTLDSRSTIKLIPFKNRGLFHSGPCTLEIGVEYVVVPSTFSPNVLGEFKLMVSYQNEKACVFLRPAKNWNCSKIKSEWSLSKNTAGGCRTNNTWRSNPLFMISNLPQKQFSVNIVLTKLDENKTEPCGFYVHSTEEPPDSFDLINTDLITRSKFSSAASVVQKFTYKPQSFSSKLLILPTTHASFQEMPFELEVYSTEPLNELIELQ